MYKRQLLTLAVACLLCVPAFAADDEEPKGVSDIKEVGKVIRNPITIEATGGNQKMDVVFNHSSHRRVRCQTCHLSLIHISLSPPKTFINGAGGVWGGPAGFPWWKDVYKRQGQHELAAGIEGAVPRVVGVSRGVGGGAVAAVAEREDHPGGPDDVEGAVERVVPGRADHPQMCIRDSFRCYCWAASWAGWISTILASVVYMPKPVGTWTRCITNVTVRMCVAHQAARLNAAAVP